eukprot:CAMPEP_0181136942 /NCGR_PEP_ID=MMETSP1071-20121207/33450_1 /TAXON_ID=35127 /ORGANISM="Thalassiosira sp., Strain NH16" /LENGTH=271 /DNA_ID=CAMNT_0023223681 /DNA_START=126 /DNA_END=938 /DNA_ORIENTATION=-
MNFSILLTCALLMHIGAALAFSADSASISRSRVTLKGIDATQFRHPLDRDLTSFVQGAPFTGLAEEAIRAVKVSPDQMPELYKSMEEASGLLDLKVVPELYIQSSAQANAFTLALEGRDNKPPIVVVTSALLDRCTDDEVQAIIGHELGHLKCSHSLYLSLGSLASTPLRGLPLLGSQAEQLLQRWRLAAEYSCDRAALLVAQDVNVVAGAMLKLFAGTSRATNTQALFIDQSLEYETLLKDANPIVRASIRMQQRTHPLPVKRVAELEKW